MATKLEQVMNLACCSQKDAEDALLKSNDDVIEAVDRLLEVPKVKGNKYLPPKPTIDDGLTDEVRNKLKQARDMFDLLNAARPAGGTQKTQGHLEFEGGQIDRLRPDDSAEQGQTQVPTIPSFEPSQAGNLAKSS
jgi:hypothetical protein